MEDFHEELNALERRSLARVAPTARIWAAVENATRNERLGFAEVVDFSGLGLALSGLAGDPVAAIGDQLWVTLVADEGIIPLRARLVHIRRSGVVGLKAEAPAAPGQHFLLRLYDRASSALAAG